MEQEHIFELREARISESRTTVTLGYNLTWQGDSHEFIEVFSFVDPLPVGSVVDSLVKALHLAASISYYKATLAPEIRHPYAMDSHEAKFWNTVFTDGLGEYLYNNGLSAESLASFSRQDGIKHQISDDVSWNETALIAISGGKDSAVARELLRDIEMETTGFVISTASISGQAKPMADAMKTEIKIIERHLDPKITDLNNLPSTFNGHIPISVIYAVIGCLVAATQGSKYMVIANEASSSLPQAKHEDRDVNHQWSKSFDFELLFQDYVQQYISTELVYFSAVRQLTSVAVAKVFSQFPSFYNVFTSDNYVFRMDPMKRPENGRWSIESPKSLSSFILLAPWVEEEKLIHMFGANFLDLGTHENMLRDLLGRSSNPILDCVGTPDELLVSLNLAATQGKFAESHLMGFSRNNQWIYQGDWQTPLRQLLAPKADHAIPDVVFEKLRPALAARLAA